jgi:hypothetical protein
MQWAKLEVFHSNVTPPRFQSYEDCDELQIQSECNKAEAVKNVLYDQKPVKVTIMLLRRERAL